MGENYSGPPSGRRTPGARLRLVDTEDGLAEDARRALLEDDDVPGNTFGYDLPEDYDLPEGVEGSEGERQPTPPGITVAEEGENAGRALLNLVLDDPDAWGVYEKQCGQGLLGMATRAKVLRLALEERAEIHDQEAVEVAIPEMALDTHPDSPAAAWERLHALDRIRQEHVVNVRDGAVPAVVDAVAKGEGLFKTMTHLAVDPDGPNEEDLLAVAQEMYVALRRRGLRFSPKGFSDAVWRAVREVLPDAPGVRWDDAWADGLMRRAAKYVGKSVAPENYDGDLPGVSRAEAEVCQAYAAEDRRRYRRAVVHWAAAALARCTVGDKKTPAA